jgi:hypothetical protein
MSLLLATQLIEARARQRMHTSLYDWIVYKRRSKAREKERRRVVAPLEGIYNPLVT